MADSSILSAFTQKLGPLPGWQWAGIVGIGALAIMAMKAKKKGTTDAASPSGQGGGIGEFSSSQSQESVDPVTGQRTSSQYQASGPLNGWGGGVGVPMGYPMPFTSGGDVYVNLPGNTPEAQPQQPPAIVAGVHYPPKDAPGPQKGQYGGYWWTPLSEQDAAMFETKSVPGLGAQNAVPNRMRIIAANPQIDWTKGDFRSLIGQAMYIPPGTIGGLDSKHQETPWPLPPSASLHAPAGYNPPTFQSTVSVANG